MKRGSFIAQQIDSEFQRKKRVVSERQFMKENCDFCKYKTSYRCNITQTIYGDYTCVEFERKEDIL